MNDKISALMDGELDEKSAAEMIDWLGRDGDALRVAHLSDPFVVVLHPATHTAPCPCLAGTTSSLATDRRWLSLH